MENIEYDKLNDYNLAIKAKEGDDGALYEILYRALEALHLSFYYRLDKIHGGKDLTVAILDKINKSVLEDAYNDYDIVERVLYFCKENFNNNKNKRFSIRPELLKFEKKKPNLVAFQGLLFPNPKKIDGNEGRDNYLNNLN